MKKVSKIFLGLGYAALGIILGLVFQTGLLFIIIIAGCMIYIGMQDMAIIKVNHAGTYKNRWTGKLINDSLGEGVHWTVFFTYVLDQEIDSTKNEFKITVGAETSNDITITLKASLWTKVNNAYNYQRVGMNDIKDRIVTDWEDTIKTFISKHTDIELRELQNGSINLEDDDTLLENIEECGMEKISYNIGTFILPESIKEANNQAVISRRRAKADDFDNKERTKRTDLIEIEILLSGTKEDKTLRALRVEALEHLDLTTEASENKLSHENECDIAGEMLAKTRTLVRLEQGERLLVREQAEKTLSVREGRTKDYQGLGGSRPMVNV